MANPGQPKSIAQTAGNGKSGPCVWAMRRSFITEHLFDGDAMDASLPMGKELRLLNAEGMNSRLSGREALSDRGGSSDGYGIKVPMA